jgi:hypothetical protein
VSRALVLFAVLAALPSSVHAQSRSSESIHAVPVRAADRPLTLPEGSFRLDQALVFRAPASLSAPQLLSAGLTDWLEIGLAWPITRDPTFLGTLRIAHSDVVDFAVRVAVTVPAITPGDTDLVVSLPVVFRIDHAVRIATGVSGDFLLTQRMQPLLRFPLSIVISPSDRHFVSIDGAISLVDRRFWHGEVGITYGHTAAATALRPIGEMRLGSTFDITHFGFAVTIGFSFWATVNPVSR